MATIEQQLANYLDIEYATEVWEETDENGQRWYMVRHPELPGCMSDGATRAEALANLADARALYLRALLEDRLPVPTPKQGTRTLGTGGTARRPTGLSRARALWAIQGPGVRGEAETYCSYVG